LISVLETQHAREKLLIQGFFQVADVPIWPGASFTIFWAASYRSSSYDQPQELLGCGGIASFDLRENLSDIGHKGQNTAENDGMPPVDLASNLNASTERAGGNHNCFVY
jgi:hypothetical protein